MRRVLWLGFSALCAFLVFRVVRSATLSPEERIRDLFESMAEGFDDGSPRRAVRGLADEWRDDGGRVDRQLLSAGLWRFFREEGRDAASGGLAFRVELPADELLVDYDPAAPEVATVTGRARFLERRGVVESLAWELDFDCALELRDDGWRIVRSETRTLSGRRP